MHKVIRKNSEPGGISDIYAMNVIGNGLSLAIIEAPIRNCHFMNGKYTGDNVSSTLYTIEKSEVDQVTEHNWVKVPLPVQCHPQNHTNSFTPASNPETTHH